MKNIGILILLFLPSWNLNGQDLAERIKVLEKENKELKKSLEDCKNSVFLLFLQVDKQLESELPKTLSKKEIRANLISEIKEHHPTKIDQVESITKATKQLIDYCDNIKGELIERSGGLDSLNNKPIGCRDKDIVNLIMFKEERAKELKKKIHSLRKIFLTVGEKDQSFKNEITLKIKEPPSERKISWEEYKFSRMPLCAILPMITMIKEQAKESEIVTLQYLKK